MAGIAVALGSAPASANSKYAGIVVDAKTGKTLYAHDADELRYPASLTKMMTLYLTFEALELHRLVGRQIVELLEIELSVLQTLSLLQQAHDLLGADHTSVVLVQEFK